MNKLNGTTLLIGKEAQLGQLCVAISRENKIVAAATLGAPDSVPATVSRCLPAQGVAHCKIEIDTDGAMRLTNLKAQNVTFADGIEVVSKRITAQTAVTLGSGRYPLDLSAVLAVAEKTLTAMQAKMPPKPLSIAHLEGVWHDYQSTLDDIQRRQQQRARRRMLPMMIGSAASIIAPLLALATTQSLFVTVPIAVVSFSILLKNYLDKDTSIEERRAASDRFMDAYVCPNPDCRHFMGNTPYKVLRQNKKCPYCGHPLTADEAKA